MLVFQIQGKKGLIHSKAVNELTFKCTPSPVEEGKEEKVPEILCTVE